MSQSIIREAQDEAAIHHCWPVMQQLRPHFDTPEAFIAAVKRMRGQGFRLAYLDHGGEAAVCAGFRIHENLVHGLHMYVDDLVTHERHRSKGLGKVMLDWLRDLARAEGCQIFDLDSGTHRQQAHRFYLREGMVIAAFHFTQSLDSKA